MRRLGFDLCTSSANAEPDIVISISHGSKDGPSVEKEVAGVSVPTVRSSSSLTPTLASRLRKRTGVPQSTGWAGRSARTAQLLGLLSKPTAVQIALELTPRQLTYDSEHLNAALRWLGRAQDSDVSGGVPTRYHFALGWDRPSPAATGTVISTLLHVANCRNESAELIERANRMGLWLLEVQEPDGSIRGDLRSERGRRRSEIAETGEVVLGLLALHRQTGDARYAESSRRATRWLETVQEPDGSWNRLHTDGTTNIADVRAAWALARAGLALDDAELGRAAERHLQWVANRARPDGWIVDMPSRDGWAAPSSDAIAATVEGLLELGLTLAEPKAIELALGLLEGVRSAYESSGSGVRLRWRHHLAAQIDADWTSTSRSACLSGSARMAVCAYRLARFAGHREAAAVRSFGDVLLDTARTGQILSGSTSEIVGGLPASAPIWGTNEPFSVLTSGTTFLAHALLERQPAGLPRHRLG